jgi:hypothetical protein
LKNGLFVFVADKEDPLLMCVFGASERYTEFIQALEWLHRMAADQFKQLLSLHPRTLGRNHLHFCTF